MSGFFSIIARDPYFRYGVKCLLEKMGYICLQEWETFDDIQGCIPEKALGLFLVDNVPLTRKAHAGLMNIRQTYPDVKLFAICKSSRFLFLCAMKNNFYSYMSNSSSLPEIVHAINFIEKGLIYRTFIENDKNQWMADVSKFNSLVSREIEVLQGFMRGESMRTLSETLGINVKVISMMKSRIMLKLQVNNMVELLSLSKANIMEY
jgi:DNA-binding NarL/FixJ family response regulator